MSLPRTAVFAFGLAAIVVASQPYADTPPRHRGNFGYPSALGPGILIYGPSGSALQPAQHSLQAVR